MQSLKKKKMVVECELMQQAFLKKLKTMGFTQTLQTNEEIEHNSPKKVVVHGSTKGSCIATQLQGRLNRRQCSKIIMHAFEKSIRYTHTIRI